MPNYASKTVLQQTQEAEEKVEVSSIVEQIDEILEDMREKNEQFLEKGNAT